MKSINKYITSSCLLLAILFFSSASLKAQHSRFNGTWKVNQEKSDLGGTSMANLFDVMVIKQTDKTFIVETTTGDSQRSVSYNTDGSEVKSKMENPKRDRVSYFKWIDDKSFETRHVDSAGSDIYTTTSTVTQSSDGKSITMATEADYKNYGKFKINLVLDKQ